MQIFDSQKFVVNLETVKQVLIDVKMAYFTDAVQKYERFGWDSVIVSMKKKTTFGLVNRPVHAGFLAEYFLDFFLKC